MSADFAQIELRVLAHVTSLGKQQLQVNHAPQRTQRSSSCSKTRASTSSAAWPASGLGSVSRSLVCRVSREQIPLERVSAVERERAKRIVYAVIYGIGKEKLGWFIAPTLHSS